MKPNKGRDPRAIIAKFREKFREGVNMRFLSVVFVSSAEGDLRAVCLYCSDDGLRAYHWTRSHPHLGRWRECLSGHPPKRQHFAQAVDDRGLRIANHQCNSACWRILGDRRERRIWSVQLLGRQSSQPCRCRGRVGIRPGKRCQLDNPERIGQLLRSGRRAGSNYCESVFALAEVLGLQPFLVAPGLRRTDGSARPERGQPRDGQLSRQASGDFCSQSLGFSPEAGFGPYGLKFYFFK